VQLVQNSANEWFLYDEESVELSPLALIQRVNGRVKIFVGDDHNPRVLFNGRAIKE
jgi:hypothetical protein